MTVADYKQAIPTSSSRNDSVRILTLSPLSLEDDHTSTSTLGDIREEEEGGRRWCRSELQVICGHKSSESFSAEARLCLSCWSRDWMADSRLNFKSSWLSFRRRISLWWLSLSESLGFLETSHLFLSFENVWWFLQLTRTNQYLVVGLCLRTASH